MILGIFSKLNDSVIFCFYIGGTVVSKFLPGSSEQFLNPHFWAEPGNIVNFSWKCMILLLTLCFEHSTFLSVHTYTYIKKWWTEISCLSSQKIQCLDYFCHKTFVQLLQYKFYFLHLLKDILSTQLCCPFSEPSVYLGAGGMTTHADSRLAEIMHSFL